MIYVYKSHKIYIYPSLPTINPSQSHTSSVLSAYINRSGACVAAAACTDALAVGIRRAGHCLWGAATVATFCGWWRIPAPVGIKFIPF